jgi:hypothetical protein
LVALNIAICTLFKNGNETRGNNMGKNNEMVVNMPIHRSVLGKLILTMLLIGILPVIFNAVINYRLAKDALSESVNEMQSTIEKSQTTYLLDF